MAAPIWIAVGFGIGWMLKPQTRVREVPVEADCDSGLSVASAAESLLAASDALQRMRPVLQDVADGEVPNVMTVYDALRSRPRGTTTSRK